MKMKMLKPKANLQVRKPDGSLLAADWETVTLNAYWLRRISEGDLEVREVTELAPTVAETEQAASNTPAAKTVKVEK
ncbi:TPA: DUF2635 domain-containing protein [Yersinia enterocolitica]|uniref:DUF2635 domain-containing protein n=1 Tax=Yersinia enterocolitica TaxID=630 RepID=UPI0005E79561|nr:DUF2635 domain-containing protein [Yersinia enterocolitica]CNE96592.1 Protein of uncharacterised function (DUF2635) [Yersinia enterocolitica]HDL6699457.1 DUF2635 domain-containing protein [Yersinia enterocolitica]HDL8252492.1 DUF2635 domain-containing protein [Yersinia enterocolitica]HEN3338010.1 DUF2635 domain-containing protein [Yersinia enterocolitica]